MKLGKLKQRIRGTKNPSVCALAGGIAMPVVVQKGSLLDALDEAFPGGTAVETGLTVGADGLLTAEGEAVETVQEVSRTEPEPAAQVDLEDWLDELPAPQPQPAPPLDDIDWDDM